MGTPDETSHRHPDDRAPVPRSPYWDIDDIAPEAPPEPWAEPAPARPLGDGRYTEQDLYHPPGTGDATRRHPGPEPVPHTAGTYPDRTVTDARGTVPPVADPWERPPVADPWWHRPAATPGPADPPPAGSVTPRPRTWSGEFRPYVVGIPGAAATSGISRVDPDTPHRPDTVLDGAGLLGRSQEPVASYRAASVRGLSHRHAGKTRQDEYSVRQTADLRHLVAVVADGVGAGEHSHRAATLVAQRGSDLLAGWLAERAAADLPWSTLAQQLSTDVTDLGKRLLARAGDRDTEPTDREVAGTLATTALFAVVELDTRGFLPVHLFRIGDSSAWVLRGGRRWEPQQPVKNAGAEIASSATAALPGAIGADRPAVRTALGPADVLVLVTDGIGDPLQDGDNDFGDYLADRWSVPPSPLAFAAQVDFARKSFDDDRTAVAVWPGA